MRSRSSPKRSSTLPFELIELETPALLLSKPRLERNIARMRARLDAFGTPLRPHIKTVKCAKAYAGALEGAVGVTVSTLLEAEYAFETGVQNILYAVGIAPNKLERAVALITMGADLTLVVDTLEAARAVDVAGAEAGVRIPVLVEIDSDDKRAGVRPASEAARGIALFLNDALGARYRGVMTHAGGSYDCRSTDEIKTMAERERRAVVDTAALLRRNGVISEIVSVGSTPTATFGESFEGVTEVRAGVYMLNDLVMRDLNCCETDEIALSVLSSVIGRNEARSEILIDAGWTALSRDLGHSAKVGAPNYGEVCDAAGAPLGDLVVSSCNQEHGIATSRSGARPPFADLPVGALVRVLPNHACATAGQFRTYFVVDGQHRVIDEWPRIGGWRPAEL